MTPASVPIIETRQLQLAGAGAEAAFDFRLEAGAHWLISGSVDSLRPLFIKTLIGLIPPAAGQVLLGGEDTEQTDAASLLALRRRLGVVLEQDGLLPAWTGLENLVLPLRYHGLLADSQILQRIETARRRYGLPAAWLEQPVAGLSPAQRSALALLRALLMEPLALVVEDLALTAITECGEAELEALLVDAFAGPHGVLLCQHQWDTAHLPASLASVPFCHARLIAGKLELSN